MSDLVLNRSRDGGFADGERYAAFRTLLAGGFAAADCRQRRVLEELLAEPTGKRMHRITPGCSLGHDLDRAAIELADGEVDLVLLDLDGPVPALLDMIEHLRGLARLGVVFVGVLPLDAAPLDRLYLSSVMDAVVEGPLLPGALHDAIADALDGVEFLSEGHAMAVPCGMVRH